jgi:hypothetical protein
MANGPLSPGKIVALAITASLAINGVAVTVMNASISRQQAEISDIRKELYKRTDDRYRRREAVTAHKNITDRIHSVEKRDDKIEATIDEHIRMDRIDG